MSSYLEGQTHQLMERLESENFTPRDMTLLGQFNNWPGILDLIHGRAEIVAVKHIIDCDAAPFLPQGWSVHEEDQLPGRVRCQVEWNPANVALWRSDEQKRVAVTGDELKKELALQSVLPANVLDHLLANPHLIPETWKGKYVFFWGTVYRSSDSDPYVRYLGWFGGRWSWSYDWLGSGWVGSNPAAVLAS